MDVDHSSHNPWSFNNNVNMLYIDQPVQTGYPYGTLVNGTFNLVTEMITPENFTTALSVPPTNTTFGAANMPAKIRQKPQTQPCPAPSTYSTWRHLPVNGVFPRISLYIFLGPFACPRLSRYSTVKRALSVSFRYDDGLVVVSD